MITTDLSKTFELYIDNRFDKCSIEIECVDSITTDESTQHSRYSI